MRVAVLLSGRGSNFQALLDAALPVEFVVVAANRPDAAGLGIARAAGIPVLAFDHKTAPSREAFDAALADALDAFQPDLLVLAGYLRILTPAFITRFAGRMLNIHPSLLPAFPGLDTHARALEAGVCLHGCTVHVVTADLDHGPIVLQAAVPVHDDDTPASLATRVLKAEHRVYPQAVRWFAEGRVRIDGHRVRLASPADAAVNAPGAPGSQGFFFPTE